jgi:hypothetical protein
MYAASVDLKQMPLNPTQLAALSRMFSPSVFREMAKRGRSALFRRLFGEMGDASEQISRSTVGATFDAAFALLRRTGWRDEYVYRAALTHNVLLGRHSLRTASMLTEFRAGACKADLVILNGTSSVYEIKSERDSLGRLANQIANYRKVFAKVYVIVGEQHLQEVVRGTPCDVGVMILVRWDRIQTIREAVNRPDVVCPETIFDSLRQHEARAILDALGVPIPEVPNTLMYSSMRRCFAQLEPAVVHDHMVATLKRTRNLSPIACLIEQLPQSLQPAALSFPVKHADHQRLVDAIHTPISEAMSWT